MRTVLAAAVLAAVLPAQTVVQVTAGALTCGACRRTPPTTAASSLNVQTYCWAGSVVVTNHSTLIPPGASVVDHHNYGAGCATGSTGSCDLVTWQFTDAGNGAVAYQVTANGAPTTQGTLP